VEHEGDTFGRGELIQDDEQGEPDGIGQEGLVLGVGADRSAGRRLGPGAGPVWVERQFGPTRDTTVVSQPPRFSTAPVSDRLNRSQASWTASSASLAEPRIR
jgi:hypothetical protein